MRHLLEYAASWLLLQVLGALPRPVGHGLAAALAYLLYGTTSRFRRIADQNLRMALPRLDASGRRAVTRGVYRSLGRLLAVCAHFPRSEERRVGKECRL